MLLGRGTGPQVHLGFLLTSFPILLSLASPASCAEASPTPTPQSNFTYYLFSFLLASLVAKLLWDQRRPLSAMIGGKMKKAAGNSRRDDKRSSGNDPPKEKELEEKIETLQKSLRDKESAIAVLKDKTVKQEKKIDDQTRAKSAKEKDATVKELKERFIQHQQQQWQQQKKDDQTRARLALPDSPVVKAVLDATLQENKDLHLRLQAMVLQAQEEKKTVGEISQMIDNYKRELAEAESRNQILERELQAAKAETMKIQRQIAQLREPLSPSHFSAPESPNFPPSNTTTKEVDSDTSSQPTSPRSQPTSPRTPFILPPLKPTSQMNLQPTTPTQPNTSQPTTPRASTSQPSTPRSSAIQSSSPSQHTNAESTPPRENGTGSNAKASGSSTNVATATPPRDELADLESYDLSSLAKELDATSLGSSSLSDLMDSLDNPSPMQGLDFISLAQDTNQATGQSSGLLSPTARVEMEPPFKSEHDGYDKDFITMFSPPGNATLKKVKHNPALNNLFYTDEKSSSPPTFNLEGIDKDFLANNHDSELSPPVASPSSPTSASPLHSPTSNFALHRSGSTSPPPNNQDEFPTSRSKGTHKSIFSVFGNDNADNAHPTPSSDTPSLSPTLSPTPSFSPTLSPSPSLAPAAHDALLLSFGSKVDTNKAGLRRAKKVNFAAFSKGKVKVEPTMEDVHFCIYPYLKSKSRALFGVFDGHAGRAAADEAAALFPKEFNTQLEQSSQDVASAFTKTYATVDAGMKEFEYMGTTATVVYLWQKGAHKYLQASNVGDSTAFLCRNGLSVRLTVDHKPSAPEEKERMRLAGIEVTDNQTRINGLAVSRSLGNHFVKEQNIGMSAIPYVGECIEILPTDTHLIVASDGLWDVIPPQHAMDIIIGMEALAAASQLLSLALSHNKCNDNVTIIVARLN